MPLYDWNCANNHWWSISTTVADRDTVNPCPKCESPGLLPRPLTLPNIDKEAAGGWNQQAFNPGLGCWTKSTKEGEQIAKRRGLEPVGNEPVENLHKAAEKTKKETREQRWRDADRVMLYE